MTNERSYKAAKHKSVNNLSENKKKMKRKKSRFNINMMIMLTVILCISVFVLYNLYNMIQISSIKTTIVDIGDVSRTVKREMIVVKNEKVFYAPSDGYFDLIYPEGEKVKKGQAIAKTKNQSNDVNYSYLIELIDSRIRALKNNSEDNYTEDELIRTNNRLDYLYKEIQNRINTGDIEYIDILKKEVITLNDKKQYLLPEEDGHIKTVEELEAEKADLKKQLESKKSLVYSNYIGIVTSYYDGYEDKFNIDNIRDITVTDIKNVKDFEPVDYSKPKIKGDPLGRIVENFRWYLVCEITKDDIDYIYTEKPVNIYIEDVKIEASLEDFQKGPDGRFTGYFRVEDENFKFYEKRKYTADIEYEFQKGLKIPVSALTKKGDKEGVYVIDRTGTAVFKEIDEIGAENSEFFTIPYEAAYKKDLAKVNLYDEIIINPENVVEGRKVK